MQIVMIHAVVSFGAAPYSLPPQLIVDDSPLRSLSSADAGLFHASSAAKSVREPSWRSWRMDVTDDKNEVMRLRSLLSEAEEDVNTLNEDLIDAKQAQKRANTALEAKDRKLISVTEELDQLRKTGVQQPQPSEATGELQSLMEERGWRTEKDLEDYIQSQAQVHATELVEDMRTEWEANRVIEMAKEKEERDRAVSELASELTRARAELVSQQRGFAERLASKQRMEESEHITQLLQNLAEVQQSLTEQRTVADSAEDRNRKLASEKMALEQTNRNLSERLRARDLQAEQTVQAVTREQQAEQTLLREQVDRLARELEEARSVHQLELARAEEEVAAVTTQSVELKDVVKKAEGQLADGAEEEVAAVTTQSVELKDVVKKAEGQLADAMRQAAAQQRRFVELQQKGEEQTRVLHAEELSRLEEELKTVREELHAESEQRQDLKAASLVVQENLREAEEKLSTAEANATEQAATLRDVTIEKEALAERVAAMERELEETKAVSEQERASLVELHRKEVDGLSEQIATLVLASPLHSASSSPTRNASGKDGELMERELEKLRSELEEKRRELRTMTSMTTAPIHGDSTWMVTPVDAQQALRRESHAHVEAMVEDLRRLRSELSTMVGEHARMRMDLGQWRPGYPLPAHVDMAMPLRSSSGPGMYGYRMPVNVAPYNSDSYRETPPRDSSSSSPPAHFNEWEGRRDARSLPAKRWPWFLRCFG
eukprot:CAMPEP_0196759846 /NCGR_PEP_ID=MMETSP1091-20130531/104908_1 /TAXON_ID=302021 /ORGANISM="Rhodomonas sp., Strain CCMP768" /LENGTH=720 /DNA_ID=CAMNT_0042108707 /DNA_START=162 /DNA_END=2320 /DNA_ORIENTATION=+